MGKIKLLLLGLLTLCIFTFPNFVKADPAGTQNSDSYGGTTVNATVTSWDKTGLHVEILEMKDPGNPSSAWEPISKTVPWQLVWDFTNTNKDTYNNQFQKGDQIVLNVNASWEPIEVISAEWSAAGESSTAGFRTQNKDIWDKDRIVYNKLFKVGCRADLAITCWLGKVFSWAQTAILILSTGVIVGAGLVYMTSAGNPNRVALAKKLILGALTGVAVIVLGKFFLTKIIGVSWL